MMLAIKPADGRPFLRSSPELEREIGDKPGKLLLQLDYWIRIGKNFIDGKWWTYQSTRDIKEKAFPGWSLSTINRTIKRLETLGLIEVANYNKAKYDKTRWFALKSEGVARLQSIILSEDEPRSAQNEPRSDQNGTGSAQNEPRPAQNGTTIPTTPTMNSALNSPAISTPTTPARDAVVDFQSTTPEDCIESKPEIPEVRSIPTGDEGEMDIIEAIPSQPSPINPSPVPPPSPQRHRWGVFFTMCSNQELEDMEKQHGPKVVDEWIARVATMQRITNPPGYVRDALRKGLMPPTSPAAPSGSEEYWKQYLGSEYAKFYKAPEQDGQRYISGRYANIIKH